MRICTIEGCEKEVHAKGWCMAHWSRWYKRGSPDVFLTMRGARTAEQARKFLRSRCTVTSSGCWQWNGAHDTRGYGFVIYDGKRTRTHRLAYLLFKGPVKNLCVCHRCDNPPCINPEHLFLGTQTDNMNDARNKGRMESWGTPRDKVHIARRLRNEGWKLLAIAAHIGISESGVCRIVKGNRRAHFR